MGFMQVGDSKHQAFAPGALLLLNYSIVQHGLS